MWTFGGEADSSGQQPHQVRHTGRWRTPKCSLGNPFTAALPSVTRKQCEDCPLACFIVDGRDYYSRWI